MNLQPPRQPATRAPLPSVGMPAGFPVFFAAAAIARKLAAIPTCFGFHHQPWHPRTKKFCHGIPAQPRTTSASDSGRTARMPTLPKNGHRARSRERGEIRPLPTAIVNKPWHWPWSGQPCPPPATWHPIRSSGAAARTTNSDTSPAPLCGAANGFPRLCRPCSRRAETGGGFVPHSTRREVHGPKGHGGLPQDLAKACVRHRPGGADSWPPATSPPSDMKRKAHNNQKESSKYSLWSLGRWGGRHGRFPRSRCVGARRAGSETPSPLPLCWRLSR